MPHVEKRLFVRLLLSLQCYVVGLAKEMQCLLQKHISYGKFNIELTGGEIHNETGAPQRSLL